MHTSCGCLSRSKYRKEGGHRFEPYHLHHPVLRNRKSRRGLQIGHFLGDFRRYRSAPSVSGDACGLSGRFLASRLCIQKFRSPRQGFRRPDPGRLPGIFGVWEAKSDVWNPVRNYCGFNPRASNCQLHSAGASRNRSTPMPRTAFDRSAHEVWCEECQRDRHVDLTHAALLTRCDLLNVGHGARNDLVKPATTSGDSADEARATFDPRWADFIFGNAVRDQNSPGFPGWRLLPWD